jgi:hypothetical protein
VDRRSRFFFLFPKNQSLFPFVSIRVYSRFKFFDSSFLLSAFCFLLFRFHHLSKSVGAARPRRPTVVGEVSRKMRDTASETLALPIEEAASSFSSPITHNSSSAQISVA